MKMRSVIHLLVLAEDRSDVLEAAAALRGPHLGQPRQLVTPEDLPHVGSLRNLVRQGAIRDL